MKEPEKTAARPYALHGVAVALAVLLSPATIGAPVTTPTADPGKTLIIIGASYAGSWGTPSLPGYRVVNRGVGGERTKETLARFAADVVAARPHAVLIWGHINNFSSIPAEQMEAARTATREHYLGMLRQAREANIAVLLATEIPFAESTDLLDQVRAFVGRLRGKQSYAERVNAQVRDVNAFVRDLAARERLPLLDFERVFAPDGGARKPEFAKEDRSHITPAGYAALTAYTREQLAAQRQ